MVIYVHKQRYITSFLNCLLLLLLLEKLYIVVLVSVGEIQHLFFYFDSEPVLQQFVIFKNSKILVWFIQKYLIFKNINLLMVLLPKKLNI